MLVGKAKRIFSGGPAGSPGATLAAALQDVAAPVKAALTAADIAGARAALGLGNVANVLPADLPVSSATAAAIAALNALDRRVLALAADPAPSDIAAGTVRIVKNTTTGRLSLWVNDGGTMVDLLTFTTAA